MRVVVVVVREPLGRALLELAVRVGVVMAEMVVQRLL